jgi:hypothetical protein
MRGVPEPGLAEKIAGFFKKAGFEAKVKVSTHIAKAEYCSMWFAPVFDSQGQESLTLIAKPARLLLKFNKVKKSSL